MLVFESTSYLPDVMGAGGRSERGVDKVLRGTGWEAELLGGKSPVRESVIFGPSHHSVLDNYSQSSSSMWAQFPYLYLEGENGELNLKESGVP